MRLLLSLTLLLFLGACAKPADPNNSPYPIYSSVTTIIDGTETNCENCAIFEINGRALRVTFSSDGIDECSGQGTLSYLANDNLVFPDNSGEQVDWNGTIVGENASKDIVCFPDVLELKVDKIDTNLFRLDYNGKFITVRKMN